MVNDRHNGAKELKGLKSVAKFIGANDIDRELLITDKMYNTVCRANGTFIYNVAEEYRKCLYALVNAEQKKRVFKELKKKVMNR